MRRWEDNIKTDLKEICDNIKKWVDSAKDRYHCNAILNAGSNIHVVSCSNISFMTSLKFYTN